MKITANNYYGKLHFGAKPSPITSEKSSTLNFGGNLKTREIKRGVEVHRPLIADASNVFPFFVVELL